jgi:hypothetical protein
VSKATTRRIPLLVSGFLVAAGMIMASMASSPAWAVLLKVADWQMNENSGQMLDSSGNNNNGTPTDVLQTGSTYVFNGATSHVDVPDADSLDPQENDITLTASVMVNGQSLDDDSYDVVRKGLVTTEGGDYKMEITRVNADPTIGRLHCFFRGIQEDGTDDSVNRVARPDVVDGRWHTLQCLKTSTSVVATVDGRSFTTTGSADSIDNASDVWVGAKTVTLTRRGVERGDDVFDGLMDFVSIEIAQ